MLHVLPRISNGGVTHWLARVMSKLNPAEIRFDFAVHRPSIGPHVETFGAQGCRVFSLPDRRRPLAYAQALRRVLRHEGPFQVVHSHYHSFSAVVLYIAKQVGVPVRIAHARTTGDRPRSAHLATAFAALSGAVLQACATNFLACSLVAAESLLGPQARRLQHGCLRILPGGIDLLDWDHCPLTKCSRADLGIGRTSLVIAHVGNFVRAKNHLFVLDVFREVLRRRPDSVLLLVGDGELRRDIERRLDEFQLGSSVRLLGVRRDVPAILRLADAFVFPSLWEGLPIAVVEAQAAGLPCIVSDVVTHEAALASHVRFLPLAAGPRFWADAILSAAGVGRVGVDWNDERCGRFLIDSHARTLKAIYSRKPC